MFTKVVRLGGRDSPKSMGSVAAAPAAVVVAVDDAAEEMTERELHIANADFGGSVAAWLETGPTMKSRGLKLGIKLASIELGTFQ